VTLLDGYVTKYEPERGLVTVRLRVGSEVEFSAEGLSDGGRRLPEVGDGVVVVLDARGKVRGARAA